MVKLTFYGGVNEIGGNKILLEDRKTKIFYDFGQSFTFATEFFTGWLAPRAISARAHFTNIRHIIATNVSFSSVLLKNLNAIQNG